MAFYEIDWKHSAERELRKIDPSQIPKIVKTIESLSRNPFPVGCRKLVGGEKVYRVRVGDYRIIYQVDNHSKAIVLEHVRHRKEAYR